MMPDYLLDTNVIIEILRDNSRVLTHMQVVVGAMAVVNNAVLVTDNLKHFQDVTGLQLENWVRP
ncbi:MAG TPA: hypothetical protein ENI60_06375 [Candidatus Fraserbacteria bacterium]|nr:hypothetical protein [Candidatus Fraserbacteria bacterium]